MQPVFKCDYCSFMGTEKETREHELKCIKNYDRESCFTCVHRKFKSDKNEIWYECIIGRDIPKGQIIEFCDSYEKKEDSGLFNYMFKNAF